MMKRFLYFICLILLKVDNSTTRSLEMSGQKINANTIAQPFLDAMRAEIALIGVDEQRPKLVGFLANQVMG
jgi:chorismate-pyruvate lyase